MSKKEFEQRRNNNPKDGYRWRWSEDLLKFGLENDFLEIKKTKNSSRLYTKTYQKVTITKYNDKYKIDLVDRTKNPGSLDLVENEFSNDNSKKDLVEIFNKKIFDYSKPLALIEYLIHIGSNQNDIILDFFAGSGTTGQAVMNINNQKNSSRKFILIQIPEATPNDSEAYIDGYKNISSITRNRIKRAAKLIKNSTHETNLDLGFKSFKLDKTNLKTWDPNPSVLKEAILDSSISIRNDRTNEDVLYEIILKYGLSLTTKVKTINLIGKDIFFLGAGSVVVCLDNNITQELIDELGLYIQKNYSHLQADDEQDTTKENKIAIQVIFKDAGFVNSVVKANVINNLKKLGITDVKSI